MSDMQGAYRRYSAQLEAEIAEIITANGGVPTDLGRAAMLTDLIHPSMLYYRRKMGAEQLRVLMDDAPAGVIFAPPREYKTTSVYECVRQSAGLTPSPVLSEIHIMDPATELEKRLRVAPWTMPEEMQGVFITRLASALDQHVKAASRELVTDTAARSGGAWARRLGAGENCPLCCLLVSRGPVYYTEKSSSFDTHTHCNCEGVLVKKNGDFKGKEVYKAYEHLWETVEAEKGYSKQEIFEGAIRHGGITHENMTDKRIKDYVDSLEWKAEK